MRSSMQWVNHQSCASYINAVPPLHPSRSCSTCQVINLSLTLWRYHFSSSLVYNLWIVIRGKCDNRWSARGDKESSVRGGHSEWPPRGVKRNQALDMFPTLKMQSAIIIYMILLCFCRNGCCCWIVIYSLSVWNSTGFFLNWKHRESLWKAIQEKWD